MTVSEDKSGARLRWGLVGGGAAALALISFLMGGWILGRPSSPGSVSKSEAVWTCAMHPQVRRPTAGDCPICGMDLVPAGNAPSDAGPTDRVTLSHRARAKARIRTSVVQRLGAGAVDRHLLGRVDYNEATLRTVTSWVSGRIDRLHVRVTGETIRAGQVVAALYSPEVYGAHQDLIQAQQQLDRLGGGATATAKVAATAALRSARERLRLLGVPETEVDAMLRDKAPRDRVRIRSPFRGTVIERLATEGQYVSTGAGLYRVADLSRLWVQLDAYESDLAALKVGQMVSLRVDALPEQPISGRVTFVDPVLNMRTRTARVRIEVRNRDGRLRPGMFVEAVVQGALPTERPLVIPDTAPLFTGRRSIVYVERSSDERFVYLPRSVRLGPKTGHHYPVLSGLEEGERVVIHGAFVIDADLQIRGGRSMLEMPDDTAAEPHRAKLSAAHRSALAKLMSAYLGVHRDLAGDDLAKARASGQTLVTVLGATTLPGEDAWTPIQSILRTHATAMVAATKIDDARRSFRGVSQQMATVLRLFGNPLEETLRLAHCPMALGGEGAEWIQRSEDVQNPYFGSAMFACGEVNHTVTEGTFLPAEDGAHSDHGHDADQGGPKR